MDEPFVFLLGGDQLSGEHLRHDIR